MLIENYFQLLRELIESCTLVQSFNLIPATRGESEGFIRGVINLTDGSMLYLREFVNVETTIIREMYSYQYMDGSKNLIFRYDNVEHHKKLNLPNYPHHKHDGSEENVNSSNAPMLADVLNEIESLLG
ncbi:toxin-antitoxin system TumE family protein [Argonema antarcticum]|uniref:toxin-antitoxin system TumE family protein n=1 Tax=Argonema antarcticum TaxID=2942763 RepID=UPI002011721B|nr:DUF6516 family protein [Argonema antarcticum]MCL1470012.1 DUF6516 family protein [Argonema antarcticum A004/B2]